MNAGIDYGMGLTNIDHDTGIRYGVIHSGDTMNCRHCGHDSRFPICPRCARRFARKHSKESDSRKPSKRSKANRS